MKRQLAAFAFILCLLLPACGSENAPYAENDKGAEDFVFEKIAGHIENRRVIPDTYISLLSDEDLKEDLELYNLRTAELNVFFSKTAAETIAAFYLWEWFGENGVRLYTPDTVANLPDRHIEIAGRVAHYALYRNADEMIYADDTIWPMLILELGGSAGDWPRFLHGGNDILSLGWGDDPMEEYFTLTESIISRLEQ